MPFPIPEESSGLSCRPPRWTGYKKAQDLKRRTHKPIHLRQKMIRKLHHFETIRNCIIASAALCISTKGDTWRVPAEIPAPRFALMAIVRYSLNSVFTPLINAQKRAHVCHLTGQAEIAQYPTARTAPLWAQPAQEASIKMAQNSLARSISWRRKRLKP